MAFWEKTTGIAMLAVLLFMLCATLAVKIVVDKQAAAYKKELEEVPFNPAHSFRLISQPERVFDIFLRPDGKGLCITERKHGSHIECFATKKGIRS